MFSTSSMLWEEYEKKAIGAISKENNVLYIDLL